MLDSSDELVINFETESLTGDLFSGPGVFEGSMTHESGDGFYVYDDDDYTIVDVTGFGAGANVLVGPGQTNAGVSLGPGTSAQGAGGIVNGGEIQIGGYGGGFYTGGGLLSAEATTPYGGGGFVQTPNSLLIALSVLNIWGSYSQTPQGTLVGAQANGYGLEVLNGPNVFGMGFTAPFQPRPGLGGSATIYGGNDEQTGPFGGFLIEVYPQSNPTILR